MQDCSNSNANALELLQSCTKLSTWYCMQHCSDWDRIQNRCWTHNKHPIPHPDGRAMESPLPGFYLMELHCPSHCVDKKNFFSVTGETHSFSSLPCQYPWPAHWSKSPSGSFAAVHQVGRYRPSFERSLNGEVGCHHAWTPPTGRNNQ